METDKKSFRTTAWRDSDALCLVAVLKATCCPMLTIGLKCPVLSGSAESRMVSTSGSCATKEARPINVGEFLERPMLAVLHSHVVALLRLVELYN